MPIIAGAIFLAACLAWHQRTYPGIPTGIPARSLVLALFAVPLLLAVQSAFVFLAPTHVTVSDTAISVSRGQTNHHYKAEQILDARVEESPSGEAIMRIVFRTPRGQEQTRSLAVAGKVDLFDLAALLDTLVASRAAQ